MGQDKRALVLGGSGFIGPAIVRRLQRDGVEVTLLNRGNRAVEGTRQIVADRYDAASMQAAAAGAANSYDAIIDLNCYTPAQVELAWRLLAPRAPHWIHMSTCSVYADLTTQPCDEQSRLGGLAQSGEYGSNKAAADSFLLAQPPRPAVTILRPVYIYGPGNNIDRESFIWARVLRGRPVLLPGDGTARVQFIHEDDLAEAVALAFATSDTATPAVHRVYNVAHPEQISLRRLAAELHGVSGVPENSLPVGDAAAGIPGRSYFPFPPLGFQVKVDRLMTELNWRPQYDIASGMRQTFASHSRDAWFARPATFDAEDTILTRLQGSATGKP